MKRGDIVKPMQGGSLTITEVTSTGRPLSATDDKGAMITFPGSGGMSVSDVGQRSDGTLVTLPSEEPEESD